MTVIELGRFGSMRGILKHSKSGSDFSILLKGWRQEVLLPSLLENMPKAKKLNIKPVQLKHVSTKKWSVKNIWLGFWLGPIVTFYELAIENGKSVVVIGGDNTIIEFKSIDSNP